MKKTYTQPLSSDQIKWLHIILDYRFQEIEVCEDIADLDQLTGYAEKNWQQVFKGTAPDDLVILVTQPWRMDSILRH